MKPAVCPVSVLRCSVETHAPPGSRNRDDARLTKSSHIKSKQVSESQPPVLLSAATQNQLTLFDVILGPSVCWCHRSDSERIN